MKKTMMPAHTRRKRRSAAQWQALISAQERSGLNQEVFCEKEGVSAASLSNWRRRLRMKADHLPIEKTPSPAFIEIGNMIRPLDGGIKVRLELGAGILTAEHLVSAALRVAEAAP